MEASARNRSVAALAVLLAVLVIASRAWMCDDAFITVRATQNLFGGRFFAYNGDERVQAFTNPLWALTLLLPVGLLQAPFWGPVLTAIGVSGLALALLLRISRGGGIASMAIVALCFSKSFVDFSTSGLENPLTHLLLVLIAGELFRSTIRPWLLGLYASLAFIDRMDTLLLTGPVLLIVLCEGRDRRDVFRMALGFTPSIIWIAFSVLYYGFPVPNTAYAKLNVAIPRAEMAKQGLTYALDLLAHDPVSVLIVFIGIFVGLATRNSSLKAKSLVFGIFLYGIYIVVIGGDFMSGRLWTPTLLIAIILIVRFSNAWLDSAGRFWIAGVTGAMLVLASPFTPFRDEVLQEPIKDPYTGIANERAFYSGLSAWKNVRVKAWQNQGFYVEGRRAAASNRRVHLFGYIGQFGLALGPSVHVIDDLALADALLARITFKPRSAWRIGHYKRMVPIGYIESVETGQNLIADKCIHEYFEDLREITYGQIWTKKRWRAIWKLNLPRNITAKACGT